jgi:hypothetical protein
MADSGIFMGWTRPATGASNKAMGLYKHIDGYFTRLHAEGRIANFDTVLLGAHGGDLGGFVLIRGDREKLDAIRSSAEFREVTVRGSMFLVGFRVLRAHMGSEATGLLQAYQRVAREM